MDGYTERKARSNCRRKEKKKGRAREEGFYIAERRQQLIDEGSMSTEEMVESFGLVGNCSLSTYCTCTSGINHVQDRG